MISERDDSDLWNGDEERDWGGHEYDGCPEPTAEQVDEWIRRISMAERIHKEGRP